MVRLCGHLNGIVPRSLCICMFSLLGTNCLGRTRRWGLAGGGVALLELVFIGVGFEVSKTTPGPVPLRLLPVDQDVPAPAP